MAGTYKTWKYCRYKWLPSRLFFSLDVCACGHEFVVLCPGYLDRTPVSAMSNTLSNLRTIPISWPKPLNETGILWRSGLLLVNGTSSFCVGATIKLVSAEKVWVAWRAEHRAEVILVSRSLMDLRVGKSCPLEVKSTEKKSWAYAVIRLPPHIFCFNKFSKNKTAIIRSDCEFYKRTFRISSLAREF